MNVKDLREEKIRKEANTHTQILDDIIEHYKKHKFSTKIKKFSKTSYSLIEIIGAGYLTSYFLNGDINTATQYAEYATVLFGGAKIGFELPVKMLTKKSHKTIEEAVKDEKKKAMYLRSIGIFHKYKPKFGLDFSNNPRNLDKLIENDVKSNYWKNLEIVQNPLKKTLVYALSGALASLTISLILDGEAKMIDLTGLNPIEKGLELTHYVLGQFDIIKDYISLEQHQHIGNFNQKQMMYIGAAIGIIRTARGLFKGFYQKAKAKVIEDKIDKENAR